jgi:quercetin dioxygenase-like cupin family protein
MKADIKNESLLVLTDIINILVDGSNTGYQYAVFEEQVPPLGGPPPHTHPDEEIFYIIEGEFDFILHDLENPFRALPGSVVHVPSNAVHTFKNVGETQGKMVVLLSPGRLLEYFREIGEPLTDVAVKPDLSKIPDFSRIDVSKAFERSADHQVRFVLPEIIGN